MESPDKVILESQLKRSITKLFKDFLIILEDINQDHLAVISNMSKQFPPEILTQWNYLNISKYSRIRKKILDAGNDCLRETQAILDEFEIVRDNNQI